MTSLPIGFVVLGVVLVLSVAGGSIDLLANSHAVILVFAGTLGVLAVSMPWGDVKELFQLLKSMRKQTKSQKLVYKDLIALSRRRDSKIDSNHALISFARELWEEGVDSATFEILLGQKIDEINSSVDHVIGAMKNLAKYPPALGMIGTVLGLVSLFSSLTLESRDKIGPSLALAMTATFYGLVLSNMFIMPLADRLANLNTSRVKQNEFIFQSLLMISRGEPFEHLGGTNTHAA